jgi:hypothetical protein
MLPNLTSVALNKSVMRPRESPNCNGGVVWNRTLKVLKATHTSGNLLLCGHLDILVLFGSFYSHCELEQFMIKIEVQMRLSTLISDNQTVRLDRKGRGGG